MLCPECFKNNKESLLVRTVQVIDYNDISQPDGHGQIEEKIYRCSKCDYVEQYEESEEIWYEDVI